jgi:hypothetical protein
VACLKIQGPLNPLFFHVFPINQLPWLGASSILRRGTPDHVQMNINMRQRVATTARSERRHPHSSSLSAHRHQRGAWRLDRWGTVPKLEVLWTNWHTWCPLDISWSTIPMNYRYIYRKP